MRGGKRRYGSNYAGESEPVYRPQFPFPAAPEGFTWQPCIYQFDESNVPALGGLALSAGQESVFIRLSLDKDSCFVLHAVRISDAGFDIMLLDSWLNPLMDDYLSPSLYSSPDHVTALEGPGIEVPAGSIFSVRLRG
jgi:hypothetical protein